MAVEVGSFNFPLWAVSTEEILSLYHVIALNPIGTSRMLHSDSLTRESAMAWDIATANEEWLIDLCHKTEKERGVIGECGDRVVKLFDDIAVKYGHGVTAAEAATQEFAYSSVDVNIVHIPRFYRFIQAKGSTRTKGYLFVEYVRGQNLEDVDLETPKDIVPRIAKIVAHLDQIQGYQRPPGPVGGGEPQGYLWGDDGAKTVFNSVEEVSD